MAVYATMIRDDPDSRARLRVTPEQALNFPNYHCLASWIAGGTRIPSFIGQTYPWPRASDQWARWHIEKMPTKSSPRAPAGLLSNSGGPSQTRECAGRPCAKRVPRR